MTAAFPFPESARESSSLHASVLHHCRSPGGLRPGRPDKTLLRHTCRSVHHGRDADPQPGHGCHRKRGIPRLQSLRFRIDRRRPLHLGGASHYRLHLHDSGSARRAASRFHSGGQHGHAAAACTTRTARSARNSRAHDDHHGSGAAAARSQRTEPAAESAAASAAAGAGHDAGSRQTGNAREHRSAGHAARRRISGGLRRIRWQGPAESAAARTGAR
jgi:hypothetical protein